MPASGRLSLVSDGQLPSTFRPAPFEYDPAVLGRHSDQKTVCLLSAASVGLEGALAFHAGPCRWPRRSTTRGSSADWSVCRACIRGIFNTNRRSRWVSTHLRLRASVSERFATRRQASRGVLHSRSDRLVFRSDDQHLRFLPQVFHTCGKHCGKQPPWLGLERISLNSGLFLRGESQTGLRRKLGVSVILWA